MGECKSIKKSLRAKKGFSMTKFFSMMFAMMFAFALSANAAATATNFATAIPTSLLPTGFWTLAALVLGVVATIGGVILGIKLMKRARG